MILQQFFVSRFFNEGIKEIDFSRGAEPYKLRFANKLSSNFELTIHKNINGYVFSKLYHLTKGGIMKNQKLHTMVATFKNKITSRLKH